MIGQPAIEALLSSRISSRISYGEGVVSVTEDSRCVSVTTDNGRVVTAKYAIGADGARSTVRQELAIPFTGTKPNMVWAVMDVFIDTDFPQCPEIITFELDAKSRVSWIPRERGLARFYVMLDDGGEVTLERAQASLKDHLAPHSIEFRELEWYSTFDVKERIAATFLSREGRVLLAGDAAHVHSVNGGQGLNTGIADAFALAWRLAVVLKNKQLDSKKARELLASYDTERRTIAEDVIDVAAQLVRATAQEAKEYVATIEKKAGYITGELSRTVATITHCRKLTNVLLQEWVSRTGTWCHLLSASPSRASGELGIDVQMSCSPFQAARKNGCIPLSAMENIFSSVLVSKWTQNGDMRMLPRCTTFSRIHPGRNSKQEGVKVSYRAQSSGPSGLLSMSGPL